MPSRPASSQMQSNMTGYRFKLEYDVRDYECDLEGVVNNAVYLHYLEHARHVFLRQVGVDFAALAEQKTNLLVIRVEIDYLYPLRSRDRFYVGINMERVSRLRFGFHQHIYRLPDEMPIAKALVIGTAVNASGRPFLPDAIERLLDNTAHVSQSG
ncbi:MAG: acyl-CoA thioesterase [Chloroflexi bacterium]|nr:acyl-CoA thioesterase [Chloroflexota bacterium]MCL5273823.1 acyl-CoA thioesterase [Chloroflexota bacterium]